jgi:hypothetical protein
MPLSVAKVSSCVSSAGNPTPSTNSRGVKGEVACVDSHSGRGCSSGGLVDSDQRLVVV